MLERSSRKAVELAIRDDSVAGELRVHAAASFSFSFSSFLLPRTNAENAINAEAKRGGKG